MPYLSWYKRLKVENGFLSNTDDVKDPTLYDFLSNSYDANKKQDIGGYILDPELSTHNHQAYFHPQEKKLVFAVTGTHTLSDVGTDIKLGLGRGFKESHRYKSAESALENAKAKYGVESASVVGHSLGGAIAGNIASSQDKVITLNKGATIGQKVRQNEQGYRVAGDVVSALNANSTHMTTLEKKHSSSSGVGGLLQGALDSHNSENIKNEPIYV